ncbi:FtsK/SpoIIIE domain-containing protein [Streptomyces sp. NBC_00690]|uniref:FtsK/SpoIIIE domain-containing protein n=1 Tax=Streptomyces sp. NBC_00690 TaxID=2975808 RepID=UPI002E295AD3|nr:FtsK/SpoIIIE domain-containing protein [Streptomyces sp. NBC_00690]
MNLLLLALAVVTLAWVLGAGELLRRHRPVWHWCVSGYPVTTLRVLTTWRRLTVLTGLAVSKHPPRGLLTDLLIKSESLRPIPPRISFPRATRLGLAVTVHLRPGQTPTVYMAASDALAHAWKVHAVRVTSPKRGLVVLTALGSDPLARPALATAPDTLLSAVVGIRESGLAWVMDLLEVPHWLITGATRSGKSTLLARLIIQLAPQRVALVGIDCKGGMELGPFAPRLSTLATSRREAIDVLSALLVELQQRMRLCRSHDVRSVWELHPKLRPIPVVVIVDELAELYLSDGTRENRTEAERCSVSLLRLAQLGAALGIHLVVAGQRVGSDLGPGVTALRAQLGGRVCHRVNDPGTAEMTLGDLNKDAVVVAQSIGPDEAGVTVIADSGGVWERARSHRCTPKTAAAMAGKYAALTPRLRTLQGLPESGTA